MIRPALSVSETRVVPRGRFGLGAARVALLRVVVGAAARALFTFRRPGPRVTARAAAFTIGRIMFKPYLRTRAGGKPKPHRGAAARGKSASRPTRDRAGPARPRRPPSASAP